jgi:hypothetical protein
VGQYVPVRAKKSEGGVCIDWMDGVATRAVRAGGTLMLTHLESGAVVVVQAFESLHSEEKMVAVSASLRVQPVMVVSPAGDAKVLERLNPLLESPPCWVLAERGETQAVEGAGDLQVVATLTPPTRYGSAEIGLQGSELSPALANRFSIVHMPVRVFQPCSRPLHEWLSWACCGAGPAEQRWRLC